MSEYITKAQACEAVRKLSCLPGHGDPYYLESSVIAAIRAIPSQPEVGEEDLVEEVAMALVVSIGDGWSGSWIDLARASLRVIRSHDRRAALSSPPPSCPSCERMRGTIAAIGDLARSITAMLRDHGPRWGTLAIMLQGPATEIEEVAARAIGPRAALAHAEGKPSGTVMPPGVQR